jgi:hypothetical protein
MAAFRMSKWYLDCIDDSGDVSIAYSGAVRWGSVRLRYSSLLESRGGRVSTNYSLRSRDPRQLGSSSIQWRDGEWARDEAGEIRQTIFTLPDGSAIEWRCVFPRAKARVRNHQGLGYVEHLSMTIAPWRLPIKTLRWGRFLTATDWIVWIDWQGPAQRRIVYLNGALASVAEIRDDAIGFDDGARLLFDRSLVLRDGALGSTALSVIPGIRDTLSARLLQVWECKWRSHARWERSGEPPSEGWAIHERVDWPE